MEKATDDRSSTPNGDAPPNAKRARSIDGDDGSDDSKSDFSGQDAGAGAAAGSNGSTKSDSNSRLSLRKEKKSAREKARRQRENALFEELANMCNVPADTRDKSSVLKAVIKRVEELRSRSNGVSTGIGGNHFGALSASSSMSSMGAMDGKMFAQPNANAAAILLQPHQQQAQHNQGTLDDLLFASTARSWNPAQAYGVFSQSAYVPPSSSYSSGGGTYGMANTPSAFNFPANALSSTPLPIHHTNGGPNGQAGGSKQQPTMGGSQGGGAFPPPPPASGKSNLGPSLAGSSLAFIQLPYATTGKLGESASSLTTAVKLQQSGTNATDVFEASSSFNFA